MILVAGETLVDLVVGPEGAIDAALGGAPSNVAVAAARLGAPVAFAGAVSTDRFGQRLMDRLVADGIETGHVVRVDEPTSLAMAELDASGAATYRFYFAGTSVPQLRRLDAGEASVLVTGGLGLVVEPMASVIESAVVARPCPIVVDVNCRPAVIADLDAYRTRLERIIAHTDVVKVSDEDLEVLHPGLETDQAAAELAASAAGVVVVTRGATATSVLVDRGGVEVPVDPLPSGAAVVDTIGAGDTFVAGLVTALHESGAWLDADRLTDTTALAAAVRFGHAAAAITVTRRGADPPTRSELDAIASTTVD